MSAAGLAIVDCSSCFGVMESRPVSIASTGSIARKVFPCASGKPGVVLLAHVRRSLSKQRPMPAGRWISSTINSPAAGASASSMWVTTSRANAWRQSRTHRFRSPCRAGTDVACRATEQARHDCFRQRPIFGMKRYFGSRSLSRRLSRCV